MSEEIVIGKEDVLEIEARLEDFAARQEIRPEIENLMTPDKTDDLAMIYSLIRQMLNIVPEENNQVRSHLHHAKECLERYITEQYDGYWHPKIGFDKEVELEIKRKRADGDE